jgi:hypothetical protein
VEGNNERQVQYSSILFCFPRQFNKGYVYGVSFHNSRNNGLNLSEYIIGGGPGSSVGIATELRAGWPGDRKKNRG